MSKYQDERDSNGFFIIVILLVLPAILGLWWIYGLYLLLFFLGS